MTYKTWLLVFAAVTAGTPALAQTPAEGGWREAIARLRQARRVATAPAPRKSRDHIADFSIVKGPRTAARRPDGKAGGFPALLSGRRTPRRAVPAAFVGESEPNNSPATADTTTLGDQATGSIDPAGDADYWYFLATAGQFVEIDVDAAQFGSPLDPTLELLASDGVTSLAFNDDFDGLDSRLSYQIQTSGAYYAVIRGFGGSGGAGQTYAINFAAFTCDVVGTENEPNNTTAAARAVSLDTDGTGEICPSVDEDYWSFPVSAGTIIELDIDASQFGSPLNPVLGLFARDGFTLLAFNDDADGLDSRLTYRIDTTGTYFAGVAGYAGGPGYTYTIHFRTFTCDVVGTENEPNDSLSLARAVSLGTDGTGVICPSFDEDYWSFTATAGTTVELDVDAQSLGSPLDAILGLFASDSTLLAFSDDVDGFDPRIEYTLSSGGTFYVGVAAFSGFGGQGYTYTLHFRTVSPGPGDPIVLRADNLGLPIGLAVNGEGSLFTGDASTDRIWQVTPQGNVSVFATGIPGPQGMAWDATGNLLVASVDGDVHRVTPQGQVSRFITDPGEPFWIAIGRDGSIWLTDLSDGSIRQYTIQGQFLARYDVSVVGEFGPGPLAIAPSGEPYFSNGPDVWRLVNGQPQKVFDAVFTVWGFAFDVAGNIYVPNPSTGRLTKYGPSGAVLAEPFAVGVVSPRAVAFGRNADGATNARLFATDLGLALGAVIEANPAGVQNPGLPLGFTAQFTTVVAAADLLGGGGLSDSDRQTLDAIGNQNGRYDTGDFRAYLILIGELPAAAAHAVVRRPE
ncbi:MAG: pre-peptidase C-terminal domain-containing protein [Gemmatimonadales bacterium]